ncbi:hypothetical protein [Enterobacter mori]
MFIRDSRNTRLEVNPARAIPPVDDQEYVRPYVPGGGYALPGILECVGRVRRSRHPT